MADPDEHENAALTQPTVCALAGFSTVHEALAFIPPSKHIPYVILRAHHGRVAYASDDDANVIGDAKAVLREPEVALLNARILKSRYGGLWYMELEKYRAMEVYGIWN
jgi:hypothetical protein